MTFLNRNIMDLQERGCDGPQQYKFECNSLMCKFVIIRLNASCLPTVRTVYNTPQNSLHWAKKIVQNGIHIRNLLTLHTKLPKYLYPCHLSLHTHQTLLERSHQVTIPLPGQPHPIISLTLPTRRLINIQPGQNKQQTSPCGLHHHQEKYPHELEFWGSIYIWLTGKTEYTSLENMPSSLNNTRESQFFWLAFVDFLQT